MEQIRAFVAKRDMLQIRAILLSFLLRFDSDKWDLTQIWLRYLCQKMAVGASDMIHLPWNKHFLNCVADHIQQDKEERHPRCSSACSPTIWAQGSFHYHTLNIEHVTLNIEHVNLSPTSNFSLFSFTQWLKLFLRFSILNHNFCSGLTVADGRWPNSLRGSSVGKQTNM